MQSDARELATQVENEAAANEYAGLPHSAVFYREISATLIQQAEEIERLNVAVDVLIGYVPSGELSHAFEAIELEKSKIGSEP